MSLRRISFSLGSRHGAIVPVAYALTLEHKNVSDECDIICATVIFKYEKTLFASLTAHGSFTKVMPTVYRQEPEHK